MRRSSVRSVLVLTSLVMAGACSGPEPREAPRPIDTDTPPVVQKDDGDPFEWLDHNVSAGWFATAAQARQAMATAGAPTSPAESRSLDRAVEDPVIRDEGLSVNEDGVAPFTAAGEGVAGGGSPEPMPEFEEDEENPRFGGADDGGDRDGEVAYEDGPPAEDLSTPSSWKRARITANASRMEIGDDETAPLESFHVLASIDGHRARVVLDMVFRNPHDEAVEGIFKLRLPDGAALHFLAFGELVESSPVMIAPPASAALDLSSATLLAERRTGGAFRDARIVPRERAQRAYAAETAKQVDPALSEWRGAGVFSTRLAPMLEKASHRVTVAYDIDLPSVGDVRELVLDLPEEAGTRRVRVDLNHAAAASVTPEADVTNPVGNTATWEWNDTREARIVVRLPGRRVTAITGDDGAIGAHFATVIRPDVPLEAVQPNRRAIFAVDTSMSSNPERMNIWLDLVEAVLKRNRADLEEFAVVFFDVGTRWWQPGWTQNTDANVDAFLLAAREVALEGASDLALGVEEAVDPQWSDGGRPDCDVFLLSDGAQTWGATPARVTAKQLGAPLYCYTTGLHGTDTATLQALARASEGAVFSVPSSADVAAAAVAHRERPWFLRDVRIDGCSDVLVDGRPASVFPGQELRIAGRGSPAEGSDVVLELAQGSRTIEVRTRIENVSPSPLAPRAYGRIATGQLEELEPVGTAEARAYATHYGVVGKTCSLLMLEDEDVYEEYGIVPANDVALIRRRPVRDVVLAAEDVPVGLRTDPRARFVSWLRALPERSGVVFDDLDSVIAFAESLPHDAFDVPPAVLKCAEPRWVGVDGAQQERLAAQDPEYVTTQESAEMRREKFGSHDALRALSSLLEGSPGEPDLMRDLAFTALGWDMAPHAYGLLYRVADARPHEPETYRSMAECLERMGRVEMSMLMHEVSLRGEWDGRFGAARLISAMDYSRLLRRVDRGAATTRLTDLAASARTRIDETYLSGAPDVVVTLTWNTDRTDLDLHVTEPSGEVCYYEHTRTKIGGGITHDVTTGYGPEMYVLGHAVDGDYRVAVHYYGSDGLRTRLRSRAYITVARRWGTEHEQITRHPLLLADQEQKIEVAKFRWNGAGTR